jgi:3-carboxy-cis,cis-muconate cycloisomerase
MTDLVATRFTAGRVPDPGVRRLFSLERRWQARLDVEVALAQAEAELGIIPSEAAKAIAAAAQLPRLDLQRVQDGMYTSSHSLVPLINELGRVVGEEHARWIHWGATTQNISQTADLLLVREAHVVLRNLQVEAVAAAADLAESAADQPMAGRTHGQHAVPITFGFKAAAWIDEMLRHVTRLDRLQPDLFRVLMGGAVGSFASLGAIGPRVAEGVAARLGMPPAPVPSRAIADGFAELVLVLAMVAGTTGRIAQEVYTLMKPEFGEAEEPVPPGVVGSSTMPHKRNPQLAQDVVAITAEMRALAAPALEAMLHDHEVDASRTDLMDSVVTSACMLGGDALARLVVILRGLRLDPARMRRNLELTGGLVNSEAVMMALAAHIGHSAAHERVYEAARRAADDGVSFRTALEQDPAVSAHFGRRELRTLLDPTSHIGLSADIARATAARARDLARRPAPPTPDVSVRIVEADAG